ncbi:hypothetical protein EDC94DRAFT_655995 [Helicostylum pulchrum]|uniref:Uncharacterized protein n=1 Tax=Helicostylum pulchrum TaxID=562976 RepID=A0ABP9XYW0_9FUNG|nr:hypothetical protein EDC94DRAFT_655995 [Helicostylum pulchrum]
MTSDEEINVVIQSLQDQIKYGQEVNSELRHDMDTQSRQLSNDNDYLRQKIAAIQLDNSNYSHTQSRLETQLYAQEQELNKFKKENQQLTKTKKDVEKKLITESEEYENERSNWQQREADLYNQIRSLSVNNEPRTPRTPRRRSVTASTLGIMTFSSGLGDIGETETKVSDPESDDYHQRPTPKLAVIDSSYAREAKIAQRTIKAQDKLILDLKNDVDKQKALLQERQSESQLVSLKVVHLEHEISNVKQLNRSLMEDNESYQILLHEKTINGEFIMNPIMQVESPTVQESTSSTTGGLNLADELASSGLNLADELASSDRNNQIQKLTDEVKMLQDTNRALQLYMNKILMRIINNKQLEDVLSIDQPTTKPKEHVTTNNKPLAVPGPTPIKTVSTTNNTLNNTNTTTANRQRRRTISYWGSKVPPPPPAKSNSEREIETVEDRRRHSSIVTAAPQPERSVSTSTTSAANGGWAKALRRMSVIGWSSVKEETQNDSAVGSSLSEEEETCRKSSGSSTPSVRRSNELGTLAEE